MSVTGSLFSSVTGLKAQAQGLGIISDNIANSNTVGYKNARAQFQTLVTQSPTATTYSPGGALPAPRLDIDKQGLLQASASSTDIGVIGRGMFVVSDRPSNTNGTLPIGTQTQFTRAGSFQIDKSGNLVNTGGKYLLGVPTNAQGQPTISNPAVTTLRTVNVGNVTGSAKQTNLLRIAANLPAVPNAPTRLTLSGTLDTATAYAGGAAGTPVGTEQRSVIYSSNGSGYQIDTQLVRVSATSFEIRIPTAADLVPLGTSSAPSPALTANYRLATITLQTNGTPTLTLGNAISFADGSSLQPTLEVSGLRQGTAAQQALSPIGEDQEDVTTVVYDSLGVAHNLTLSFFRAQDSAGATGNPVTNQTRWGVMIKDMRIAATGAPSVRFPLTTPAVGAANQFPMYLDGTPALANGFAQAAPAVAAPASETYTTVPTSSIVTFNSNGTQSGSAPTRLPFLPMTTGSVDFGGDLVTLDLGQPNTTGGLTNYSNQFGVSFIQQDGIPYGFRTGVSFAEDGIVRVLFDNGQSLPVFRLPIATFAATNRLEPVSGNAYRETLESGSALTNYANVAGSGKVSPSTLEASTVDLSEEFTNMIITQRAYSANARTITTADEMLNEVVNLKR